MSGFLADPWGRLAALSLHWKIILGLASVIVAMEVVGRVWPRSRAYAGWKAGVEAVGAVWTGVLLSLVYVLSVGPVSVVMRLLGHDLLDASLASEPSFWRAHSPNPLGPRAASRHQF